MDANQGKKKELSSKREGKNVRKNKVNQCVRECLASKSALIC